MRLDLELVKFEDNKRDPAVLGKIKTIMHTVERAAYHFGFDTLSASSKKVMKLCDTKTELPKLLQAIDEVRDTLDLIEHVGTDIAAKKPKIIKMTSAPAPANAPVKAETKKEKPGAKDTEIPISAVNAIRDHIFSIVSSNIMFAPDPEQLVKIEEKPAALISAITPDEQPVTVPVTAIPANAKTILLIEDSPYFRDALVPFLSMQGFVVTCVPTANAALELCLEGRDFDIILSDSDLPDMNTTSFILRARADSKSKWSKTPILTLTTANSNDANSASKLEPDVLLQKIKKNIA